ncbi:MULTISPECIES: SBBP repeat-containing protein [Niastella]|uniref:SBBP repeat-containing protein n=1 Tax=Niastella soli TaxID=2821487 RepID=A0ABS3YXK2_9BACT|nr:SBBP repeat-containing protein [Niastella soli]MBO9202483.1 SBBP repeat-containing protein [Niastella soli]
MRTMLHSRKLLLLSVCIILTNAGISQLTQAWVARYNGTANGSDGARSLALDNNGNVYVTGTVTSTLSGKDYRTIKYSATGVIIWKAIWNGGANGDDEPFSIAVDANGNAYVTGRSAGRSSGNDFATVKYNSAGVRQWSVRYNGPGNGSDWAKSIKVDGAGNVYVTGGSVGNGTGFDYATVKYNTNGDLQWVARYDGPGINDESNALALDEDGNVYVTGRSPAGVNIDEEDMDYTTIKYNNNGQELWVKRYDGPSPTNDFDEALDITVDQYKNVYVTGRSNASSQESSNDYATVKYNTFGTQLWAARYNGPGNSIDNATSVVVDALQNVYVTGLSAAGPNETNYDYATIKYSVNGGQVWVSRYNGPANGHDEASAVALDKFGNVYVTGRSTGNGSGYDFATVKYNGGGVQQSVARYNGPANANDGTAVFIGFYTSHPIGVDAAGNVYVTGLSTGIGTGFDITTIKYTQPGAPAPSLITGVTEPPPVIPTNFKVFVAPNPASVSTKIAYQLPVEGRVSITIFDIMGRKVTTLVEAVETAGSYSVDLNVATYQSGIYTYRFLVESGNASWSESGKFSVIK